MNKIRIHIWITLNLTAIGLLFYYRSLFNSPIWMVLLITPYLLKDREQIKKEFKAEVPKYTIFLAIGWGLFIVTSAVTGFTKKIDDILKPTSLWATSFLVALTILFLAAYAKMLQKQKEKSTT